jgi:hypothetical protein
MFCAYGLKTAVTEFVNPTGLDSPTYQQIFPYKRPVRSKDVITMVFKPLLVIKSHLECRRYDSYRKPFFT